SMDNVALAQLQLGHKSIKTTTDNYFIPNTKDRKEIEKVLKTEKQMTRDEIIRDLTKKYAECNALSDKEFLAALKALRKEDDMKEHKGEYDVSYA
ncbi:MAG: hypothetical protein R6U21_03290, partial [Thermoplasmatota archaeon]